MMWYIDQFLVGEYYVWVFVVIVEDYVDVGCDEFCVQFVGCFVYQVVVVIVYWVQYDFEWCD